MWKLFISDGLVFLCLSCRFLCFIGHSTHLAAAASAEREREREKERERIAAAASSDLYLRPGERRAVVRAVDTPWSSVRRGVG